jgi:hypothetical protein
MQPGYASGMLTLSSDDVNGICSLYPPGTEVSNARCVPRHGFSSTCNDRDEQEDGGCCGVAAGAPKGGRGVAFLIAFGVALGRLRRHGRRTTVMFPRRN